MTGIAPRFTAAALGAALIAAGAPGGAAAAARHRSHHTKPAISGRLSKAGYTIVALGANGKMVWSKSRSFSLRPPAATYTLQLIGSRGVYAGPVVVGGTASKVIVGLRGLVSLGTVRILASKGYARPAKKVAPKSLVRSRWAWARRGVPLGNGRNLGLVKTPTKGTGPSGPGGDSDRSGIANAFDIAPGGNGVIKSLAPVAAGAHLARTPRAAAASQAQSGNAASSWMSQLFLNIDQTVNADAAGVSPADIDSALAANLNLKFLNFPSAGKVELDCNGLSFCSSGGTGVASEEGQPNVNGSYPEAPFPATTADPATGFGEIAGPQVPSGFTGTLAGSGNSEFSLFPHASSSQIGSGDVITEIDSGNGTTTQTPTTINFVFNTVPAIAAYSDTAGDSGTLSYPDTGGVGTPTDPIKLAAGPNGDVDMHFTLYRPQRGGIAGAGEPAFVDIGHLWYSFDYAPPMTPGQTTVGQASSPQCLLSSYSDLSPTLSAVQGGNGVQNPMLVDSAADQPASASNTIGFTVDISACMADKGQTFPVGQPVTFDIAANSQSSPDHANQRFFLERTS